MRKYKIVASLTLIISLMLLTLISSETKPGNHDPVKMNASRNQAYILLAWNDLGMHCANKYFSKMPILPPYNNQRAQLIKIGDALHPPQIDTSGFYITYEIPGNTYSVGKTDFWTYAQAIFGVSLPDNIGLTGAGLKGYMTYTGNAFFINGIPLTPYPDNDLVSEHPFQLTLIKAYSNDSSFLTSTQSVIPVSNELSCIKTGCHASEQSILDNHPVVTGYNPNATPVFCASCHKDNALGMPGNDSTMSLSEDIHNRHKSFIISDCYQCHPGPNTQCLRDTMSKNGTGCVDCHGTVATVANTIMCGREAWLQEPECGNAWCHGSGAATEPGKLYKNSRGHGGLYCSACHGSPHAVVPSREPNDNMQNMMLQDGSALGLWKCDVCHGVNPTGEGPHGIFFADINHYASNDPVDNLLQIFPNPVSETATLSFNLGKKNKVNLAIYNSVGDRVKLYLDQHMVSGNYTVNFSTEGLSKGLYYGVLKVGEKVYSKKIVVMD